MAKSMISNQSLTLKGSISTALGTGGTFEIFETGIVLSAASIVFKNKIQLERMQVSIATDGTCTVVKRGLTNADTKVEDPTLKKEWSNGAAGYVTMLASDFLDVDSTGETKTLSDNFIYTGDVEFQGDTELENAIVTDLDVTGKSNPWPRFADETARDAFYTAPVNGNKAIVNGVDCNYNGITHQWEYYGSSTPVPNASESVGGIAKIATDAEFAAGTDETAGLYNIPKVSDVKDYVDTATEIGQLVDSTYMAGEAITAGQYVFLESGPTTAQATTKQNISDVAGNTRVSFPFIGTGVAGTSFKVNICKTGTGHNANQSLNFRIETDTAGSPSGTLANANATATIAPASLTTSLADTTMTLTGSFTPTLGTKYHLVARQGTGVASYGSETVDATNYYNIGYSTNNTTIRPLTVYDGSTWSLQTYKYEPFTGTSLDTNYWNTIVGANISQNNALVFDITGTSTTTVLTQYLKSLLTYSNTIISMQFDVSDGVIDGGQFSSIAGHGVLYFDANNYIMLTRNTGVGASIGVYTRTTEIKIVKAGVEEVSTTGLTDYGTLKIEFNQSTGDIKFYGYNSGRVQISTTSVYTFTGNPYALFTFSKNFQTTYHGTVNADNLYVSNYSYSSASPSADSSNKFCYLSSTLATNQLLSLTDSDFAYKVDLRGISTETKALGTYPKLTLPVDGTINTNQTGMTAGVVQYLGATPGSISTTAGTNICQVGIAHSATKLTMKKRLQTIVITVTASPMTWTNTLGKSVMVKISGGTVNPVVNDGITIATATGLNTMVPAGIALVITYSSAPTITYSDI